MSASPGHPFRKVQPGETLTFPADLRNATIDTIELAQTLAQRVGAGQGLSGEEIGPGIISVQNNSGQGRDAFTILGLDQPVFGPTDNLEEFQFRPTFSGIIPTVDSVNAFCVLLQPLAADAVGLAVISGLAVCQVTADASGNTFVQAEDGNTDTLVLADTGAGRVLWRETGTSGAKWALVLLGSGQDIGAWMRAQSNYNAAAIQVFGHDASGVFKWYDVSTCP